MPKEGYSPPPVRRVDRPRPPPSRPTGRPSKLTPELIEAVCKGVRAGLSYKDAAIRAGICEATFHKYKARGEKGEAPFSEFTESLKEAEADLKAELLKTIKAASIESWTAAAWILERKYQAEFARQSNIKHGADLGGAFTLKIKAPKA